MPESIRQDAEVSIGGVVEGACPQCRVEVTTHDGRACCPCCGDNYQASPHGLETLKAAIWPLQASPQLMKRRFACATLTR